MATLPQTQQVSYLKAAFDGLNGSGKTGTVVRLAIGLAIEYGDRRPVYVFDSEERWRFLKPTIFDVEQIPLVILSGKSLKRLQESLDRAQRDGAAVWVGDQLTTPWMEGLRAFAYENGNLPFDRRQQLMNLWEPVIDAFRYGHFHALAAGRLGYVWSNVEDEHGDIKLQQGDSKFNAGGGNNFGYEADLELELRRRKVLRGRKLFSGRLSVEHVCDVVKDAAAGILNGKQFTFPSQDGLYKRGDYKPVLEAFRPYIDFMQRVPAPRQSQASTRDLVISGRTAWSQDQVTRKGLLEELDALLQMCFPSGDGKSKLAKMFRDLTLEYLNGFVSWSRMEEEIPTSKLERNVLIAKAMRKRIDQKEIPTTQENLQPFLDLCTEDVLNPGRGMTYMEVLMGRMRPQPVVREMDRKATDEVELTGD